MIEQLNPKEINSTALAYLGDAVYEIYVRKHVMETGQTNADRLHQMAIKYVCADGQALAVKKMINGFLSEEEIRLVKRARNHKTTSKPRHADPIIYKLATAFEALLGHLYLAGQQQRLEEVIEETFRIIEAGEKV
ncbi:MAG: ribonuclease III domain-containing protein [Anaerovoracaceae bacterium]